MKQKNKRKGRLILSLCLLLCTLVLSVGGLTILNGVSAGSDKNPVSEKSDVSLNEFTDADYTNNNSSGQNGKPIKIETVDEAIDVINNYLQNKAYVVTSTGKMLPSANIESGPLKNTIVKCDLPYIDWFAHETSGRAYWEEGYKMGKIYNDFIENVLYAFIDKNSISQLNKYYFIDDNIYFKQQARGVNFSNGFELDDSIWDNIAVDKCNNIDDIKRIGYASRPFRWDITKENVQNAKLTKKISGYQLDFDLDAIKAARDVYYRLVKYLPSDIISGVHPSGYHYSISLDKYGNILSFTRDETISMKASVPTTSGSIHLKFAFKYNFQLKKDDFKIQIDNNIKQAVINAGYEI